MAELLPAAEEPGIDGVEDRPQLRQSVLHGRPGEGDLLAGPQRPHGAGGSRRGVLDLLCLVQDKGRPFDGGELPEVAWQQPVGRDDEVSGHEPDRVRGRGRRRGGRRRARSGREASRLGEPVVDDRQRTHDEVRTWPALQVGQRGGRLAEPHVVGQAPAESEALEEAQPGQAAALIWPQRAGEPFALASLDETIVGQSGQQLDAPGRCRLALRRVELTGGGEVQERDGVDDAVLARVFVEALAGLAQRRRIDAHPPPSGVQQRCASGVGAGELGGRDRARVVTFGDDEPPVDDGVAVETRPLLGRVACATVPRTERFARTRRSGPISSMPSRSSSAGACSRNRSAASRSSSIDDGS